MSKYEPLWKYLKENGLDNYILSFKEIEKILGFKIDHSFLKYKKDAQKYGYNAIKISLKNESITFSKILL